MFATSSVVAWLFVQFGSHKGLESLFSLWGIIILPFSLILLSTCYFLLFSSVGCVLSCRILLLNKCKKLGGSFSLFPCLWFCGFACRPIVFSPSIRVRFVIAFDKFLLLFVLLICYSQLVSVKLLLLFVYSLLLFISFITLNQYYISPV